MASKPSRHDQVTENKINSKAGFEHPHCSCSIGRLMDPVAQTSQPVDGEIADSLIILDDKNGFSGLLFRPGINGRISRRVDTVGDARKIDVNRGTEADLAIDCYLSARLLGE